MERPDLKEIATIGQGRDITRGWVDSIGLLIPEDPIRRTRGATLDLYEEVLRDDQVASTLQQRRLAVAGQPWQVTPGDESDGARAAADFIHATLERIDWDDVTDRMLYARFYGFSVAECLWKIGSSGLVELDQLRVRDVRRFGFGAQMDLRLLTFGSLFGEPLPDKKFWLVSCGASHHDEPYGLGLAYWLYWPVYIKRQCMRLWLRMQEKFAAPTALGKFPQGASEEERRQLLSAILAIQSDAGITMPEGMQVELLEATRGGSAGYQELVHIINAAIAKIVLSQTMTTDQGASLAQARVHMDVRHELVEADADLIDNSFNRTVVAWLTAWNFPGVAPPTVHRVMDEPEDMLKRSERDKNIFALGYRPTLKQIEAVYGDGWEAIPLPAPVPTGAPAAPAAFSEPPAATPAAAPAKDEAPDQTALDAMLTGLDPEQSRQAMEGLLRPLFDLAKNDPDAFMGRMLECYPTMDGSGLEELMTRMMFLAETWGRLHGRD
ncbi:MAG: DUF935 family protein [Magnetococcales bacterium]|nr:DUF935 family protein [Magnetococcales bacterium]